MKVFIINGKNTLTGGGGYSIFLTVRVGYPFEQHTFGGRKLLHQKLLVKIY